MADWTQTLTRDVMSSPVHVIERDSNIEEALKILTDEEVSGAPVIGLEGEPIGVVTLVDISRFLAGIERDEDAMGSFYQRASMQWDPVSESFSHVEAAEDPLKQAKIEDVMSPDVVSVSPDSPLTEAVLKMAKEGIHRVLVIDDAGRLQGLVSSTDVVGLLAKQMQ